MKIRQIDAEDTEAVIDVLVEGFVRRDRNYWLNAIQFLQLQEVPPGQPRFGWAMEQAGSIVGVILNLWRPVEYGVEGRLVANLSSWYVKPEFRGLASMLLSKASRDPNVVYVNVSPADHTVAICEAVGFKRYSSGQVIAVPSLAKGSAPSRVFLYGTETARLSPKDDKLLRLHAQAGCLALVGETRERQVPLVFVRRRVRSVIPTIQLVYNGQAEALPHLFNAIGKFFIRQGRLLLICDSAGKLETVPSKYYPDRGVRYYKGLSAPAVGDLSFTEIAAFGI